LKPYKRQVAIPGEPLSNILCSILVEKPLIEQIIKETPTKPRRSPHVGRIGYPQLTKERDVTSAAAKIHDQYAFHYFVGCDVFVVQVP